MWHGCEGGGGGSEAGALRRSVPTTTLRNTSVVAGSGAGGGGDGDGDGDKKSRIDSPTRRHAEHVASTTTSTCACGFNLRSF